MREDSDWRDKSRIQFFEKLIERLLPDGIVLPDYTELDLNVGSLPQKEFAEAFVTVRKKHAEAIACNEAEPRAHWPGSRANALRRLRLPLLTYPSSNSAITLIQTGDLAQAPNCGGERESLLTVYRRYGPEASEDQVTSIRIYFGI